MSISMISPKEAAVLRDAGTAQFIDVRTTGEYATVRIDGSPLLPTEAITAESVKAEPDKTIVLYCASGRRSLKAAQKLAEILPAAHIVSLDGGIKAWESQGLPVIRNPKRLSIERQTQVAAGALVFCGTLLGVYAYSGFLIIPAFVGAGLMFAGLSGTCGLAALLIRAPWNANAQGAGCSTRSCTR